VGGGSVQLRKRNALDYAIHGGGNGGTNGQNVNLWNSSSSSQNLHWLISEIQGAEVRASARAFNVSAVLGQKANLKWYFPQAEDKKVKQYVIKFSANESTEMEELGIIPAEDVEGLTGYEYQHQTPVEGINFYQVIVQYEDGTANYQMVDDIIFGKKIGSIQLSPNPAMDFLNLDVSNYQNEAIDYFIQSIDGVKRQEGRLNTDHENTVQLELNNIQNGMYIIYLKPENHRVETVKFIIAKDY